MGINDGMSMTGTGVAPIQREVWHLGLTLLPTAGLIEHTPRPTSRAKP